MAHFHIEISGNGSVRHILRDGQSYAESVSLEPLFSVSTIYFKVAGANLQLLSDETLRERRRAHGVQSFIMSLTGVEAFTNTYFQLRADELGSHPMLERIGQRHGSLTRKIEELLAMTPEVAIEGQQLVLDHIHRLSLLRNDLVHPRWEPASMTLGGEVPVTIGGLVQNFQAAFEDAAFCREALMWCLLFIARTGRSRGNPDLAAFLFQWTGFFGLTEQAILAELELA